MQVRWHNGIPYLLEVNTRMSGGSHIADKVGVNFLALAIEQLVNGKISKLPNIKQVDMKVTQIETPIVL